MSLSAAKEMILDLLDAVDNGDVPSVERLIAQDNNNDIDVNARDIYGRTALTEACVVNNARIVRFLLEQGGADSNVPDQKGWTPLHHACYRWWANPEIVRLLLEHDAAVNAVTNDCKNTPLHLVTRYAEEIGRQKQKEAVVSMHLKHGARPNQKMRWRRTRRYHPNDSFGWVGLHVLRAWIQVLLLVFASLFLLHFL